MTLAFTVFATGTTTVTGSFELHDYDTASADCVGRNGYNDIEPGTPVILSNEDGKVLGSGSLSAGVASDGTCTYLFSISDVPTDAKQYVFEVSHRGKLIKSNAEMVDSKWSEGITLGDG